MVIFNKALEKTPYSFFYCLALTTGIGLSYHLDSLSWMFAILGASLVSLVFVVQRHTILAIAISLWCAGFMRQTYERVVFDHFETFFCERPCSLEGVVQTCIYEETKQFCHKIILKTTKINRSVTTKRIALYCRNNPDLTPGTFIKIKKATLKKTRDNDMKRYLMRQGIAGSVFAPTLIIATRRPHSDYATSLWRYKENLLERVRTKMTKHGFLLFNSIFLGNKEELNNEYDHAHRFNEWGLAHVLARSGLHVSILLVLLRVVMRPTYLPFLLQKMIILLFMLLFYILSTPATPFLRAFFMYLLQEGCDFLKVPRNTLHIFCITTILMLLVNPMQLFFLDFQLSFGITFLLLLWSLR